MNYSFIDFHDHLKSHGAHYFEYIVLGAKFMMIIVLSVFAMINKYTSYIIEHPDYFIQDALYLGLSSALGAMFVSYVRTGNITYRGAFIAFLFFFIYMPKINVWGQFALETVIFTLITASVEIYIDYRHNNENGKIDRTEFTKSILIALVLFVVAHVLFQFGGLYDLFFSTDECTLPDDTSSAITNYDIKYNSNKTSRLPQHSYAE